VKTRHRALLSVLLSSFTVVSVVQAQTNQVVSGEVLAAPGIDPSRLIVEISPLGSSNQPPERVLVSPTGRFEARNLEAGSYQFRVYDERGTVLGSATQNAGPYYGSVEIRLKSNPNRTPQNIVSRAVSVQSLRSDPNGKAEREFQHALWDVRDKNWKGALKHFEKAVKADEAYTRASANWAALELQLGNNVHAEEIARKALKHDPKSPRLLHALGTSLMMQGKLTDETVTSLEAAGVEQPKTYLAAAQVEYRRGNLSKARKLANSYLKTGDKQFLDFAHKLTAIPENGQ
jgi:tetratricopeptide (TPR) repeat protein